MNQKKLSNKSIIAFAIGDFYGGGAFFVIGALFLIFLTDVGGLTPTRAGLIILIGKLWDAVTDPTMGYISDHTKSKYGRRRVYFLYGIIPIIISFALLWVKIQTDLALIRFAYYLLTYLIFNSVFTMVMIPYNSLPAEMTDDYRERSKLVGTRLLFSQIGVLAGALLPLTIIKLFENEAIGFMVMGSIFGVLYGLPWFFVFKKTWEKNSQVKARQSLTLKTELSLILKQFFSTMKNKSFRIHTVMFICAYVSLDIFNALLLFYLRDYLGKDAYYQVILGVVVLLNMVALFFVTKECSRIGNARTYRRHVLIWMLGVLLIGLAVPKTPIIVLFIIAGVIGIGLSGGVMIPYNMLAFVIDVDELISTERREGTYAGMMTFIRKIAQAIALFLVGVGLDLVGYKSGIVLADATVNGIRLLFMVIPIVLLIAGFITSYQFKLNPANHQKLIKEIDRLKVGGSKEEVDCLTKEICEEISGVNYNQLWEVKQL